MSDNYCDNYMGSNTEKKPWTNLQNLYKNLSKEIKSDNFCYRKGGRAITKWRAIEKKLFRILMVALIFSPNGQGLFSIG